MQTQNHTVNEGSCNEAPSEEYCRLRYGLNEDCLLEVFDYLNVNDLIEVSKLDIYFKEIITKWIIEKKVHDLEYFSQSEVRPHTVKILQTFGKSIRKLKAGGDSSTGLTIFLESITSYCEPHKITEVEFTFYPIPPIQDFIDKNVVDQSMPYFSNLRILRLEECYSTSNVKFSEFLTKLSMTASIIEIVQVIHCEMPGGWLRNFRNLRNLQIYWWDNIVLEDLLTCLMANPKLKVFEFSNIQYMSTICNILSKYCPGLEKFHKYEPNGYANFAPHPCDNFGVDLINHYNFLSTFPNLHTVSIKSYTFCGCDLYYPLKTLATKNIIKLIVLLTNPRPIVLSAETISQMMRRPLPDFISLKTVDIEFDYCDTDADPKLTQCDLRCQFVFHFLSQLKSLQNVRFFGSGLSNLHTILKSVPNLRTLCLSNVKFRDEKEEMLKIVRTLRSNQQSNDNQHLLVLILDEPIWRKAKELENEDLQSIMKISSPEWWIKYSTKEKTGWSVCSRLSL